MAIPDETRVVVVHEDDAGQPQLLTPELVREINVPGVVHGGWFWGTERTPSLPGYFGEVPAGDWFPGASGSRLGMFEFAAHSDGKFDVADSLDGLDSDAGGDPEMHRTDSIDYEIILSGKIDVEFPGGVSTTLGPGDVLVMAGAAHAWKNRYDEPCRYVAVVFGAERP
jgi:hypothetical protein